MQHSFVFILKNSTNNQVSLLLNRDFEAFNRMKTTSSFSYTIQTLWRFFAKFFQKKPIFYFFLFCGAFFTLSVEAAEAQEKTFIATAYYSPLPNQEKYYRGSYEADKKLNGEWIFASDGTPVYAGMIAAPKNYTFGTKIELDGVWVVSVHDRGGSIVSTNEGVTYDRIDIWMGYGDEWLNRTLAWGRREITGRIVDNNTPVSLDFSNITNNAPQITDTVLKKLQAIWYQTTGRKFSEIILQFQLDHGIIQSAQDAGAGNYGPKTTAKLAELYQKQNIRLPSESTYYHNTEISQLRADNMKTNFMGITDVTVQNLQLFLVSQWYQTDNITGKMDLSTLHALRKYQSAKNIGQTGRVDVKTQITIAEDLKK